MSGEIKVTSDPEEVRLMVDDLRRQGNALLGLLLPRLIRVELPPEVRQMNGVGWIVVSTPRCDVHIETLPDSNRGNYKVLVETKHVAELDPLLVDFADGFPRYYFGATACAEEVRAWLTARGES